MLSFHKKIDIPLRETQKTAFAENKIFVGGPPLLGKMVFLAGVLPTTVAAKTDRCLSMAENPIRYSSAF